MNLHMMDANKRLVIADTILKDSAIRIHEMKQKYRAYKQLFLYMAQKSKYGNKPLCITPLKIKLRLSIIKLNELAK